jgi:hypothetical protein
LYGPEGQLLGHIDNIFEHNKRTITPFSSCQGKNTNNTTISLHQLNISITNPFFDQVTKEEIKATLKESIAVL